MSDRIRAPRWPVLAASACTALAVTGAVVASTTGLPVIATTVVGYVVGAVLTTAFAAVYRSMRNGRRSHPRFRPSPALDRWAAVAVGVGFLAGMVNAVLLATELAK